MQPRLVQARSGNVYALNSIVRFGPNAEVWQANQLDQDLEVALKIYRFPHSEPTFDLTKREYRALQQIPAAYIARPIEHGMLFDTEQPFIATEFLPGGTLKQRLSLREVKEPIRSAFSVGIGIGHALEQSHRMRLYHLDIKPSNIGFSADNRIKLIDFGNSHNKQQPGKRSSVAVGTPVYCSPEQAAGEPAGAASDVYSLGCVLYEILEGRPPFERATVLDYLEAHRFDLPPFPRAFSKGRPAQEQGVARVVGRMLMKDRRRRITLQHFMDAMYELKGLSEGAPLDTQFEDTVWGERFQIGSARNLFSQYRPELR